MTETEFLVRVDKILNHIQYQAENWFEQLDIDVDANREGYVLTLVFNNKQQVIINAQTPLQEIWLAAPSGGYHYRLEHETWLNTRESSTDLATQISHACSAIAGRPLTIRL